MTDKIYRASIHFYSNGTDDLVTVMTDVSDPITDPEQNIPAAYTTMQAMALALRNTAVDVGIEPDVVEDITTSDMSGEEKAAALFKQISTVDVVAAEISA